MKRSNSTFVGRRAVILALAAIVIGLSGRAYCQSSGTALLLQQTPQQAGTVTPAVGVHHFAPNTELILTAVPKPGYQFVYWLGDVSDPTANSTAVYLDAPKIVIAVFERSEYDFSFAEERAQNAPAGHLSAGAADYSRSGAAGGGGRRPHKSGWSEPSPEPPEPEEPDFPVPEEKDDFPIPEPIPEPATITLLALASLALRRRHRT